MGRPVVLNSSGQVVHKYGDVSRETLERLQIYVDLVLKWQPAQNLIAPSTIPDIWTRHVADSLQTQWSYPEARTWVDIGSGGGFPGVVTAILLADDAGCPCAHDREQSAQGRFPENGLAGNRIEGNGASGPDRIGCERVVTWPGRCCFCPGPCVAGPAFAAV